MYSKGDFKTDRKKTKIGLCKKGKMRTKNKKQNKKDRKCLNSPSYKF